jgi:hypothetical protein
MALSTLFPVPAEALHGQSRSTAARRRFGWTALCIAYPQRVFQYNINPPREASILAAGARDFQAAGRVCAHWRAFSGGGREQELSGRRRNVP